MSEFVRRLAEIMQRKRCDAKELAGRMGIGEDSARKFCQGLLMPRARMFKDACDALYLSDDERRNLAETLVTPAKPRFAQLLEMHCYLRGFSSSELMRNAQMSHGYFKPIWEGKELPDEWHFDFLCDALQLSRPQRMEMVEAVLGGPPDAEKFGSLLTHFRWRAGLKREQVATKSESRVSHFEYLRMELYHAEPESPEVLAWIAQRFALSPEEAGMLAKSVGMALKEPRRSTRPKDTPQAEICAAGLTSERLLGGDGREIVL
jgi:transcriptional regulator with XRE-family HTH domain